MNNLTEYLNGYFALAPSRTASVADLFPSRSLLKGDNFLIQDSRRPGLAFVRSGYLRIHAITPDGKEVTQWISQPGTFITDLTALVFDVPCRWTITALTDVQLYAITHTDYHRIGSIIPEWPSLENKFLTKCFGTLENRVFDLLFLDAEARYRNLLTTSPELFNQVPLKFLASMLGMTPETLSRLRSIY